MGTHAALIDEGCILPIEATAYLVGSEGVLKQHRQCPVPSFYYLFKKILMFLHARVNQLNDH